MSLSDHRKAIDTIDSRIVALLNERAAHVMAIGRIKTERDRSIYAPHRERAVLQGVCASNQGPMRDESLRAIYREIMSSALSLERPITVAFLGPEATFTHQAAIRRFGSSLSYSAQKTIPDVFAEVSKGRAEYGVVPVENSTEGVVTNTLDMFVESHLRIVAQVIMPIRHCLVGRVAKSRVRRIYSHPQALGQCRLWIQNQLAKAEVVETSSTTRAAELAAGDPRSAAIAGALAAERYQLRVLESDVQDSAANVTRFLVLGRECSPSTGCDRTSLMLIVADQVGALHRALSPFQRLGVNMTRIESRPSKRKAWEYYFFIDVDGHIEDATVARAVAVVEEQCKQVKVLGSYPNGE